MKKVKQQETDEERQRLEAAIEAEQGVERRFLTALTFITAIGGFFFLVGVLFFEKFDLIYNGTDYHSGGSRHAAN